MVAKAYAQDQLLDLTVDERELLYKLCVYFLSDFIKIDQTLQLCTACVGVLVKMLRNLEPMYEQEEIKV